MISEIIAKDLLNSEKGFQEYSKPIIKRYFRIYPKGRLSIKRLWQWRDEFRANHKDLKGHRRDNTLTFREKLLPRNW